MSGKQLVKVEGLTELDAALAQIPQGLRRDVLLRTLRRASQPMVRSARARAPRGTDPRRRGSGKDRRSRRSTTLGHGADSIRARAVRATNPHRGEVAIGPDRAHFYMRFAEFGTSRQPAQRFLTAAYEEQKLEVLRAVGTELQVVIADTAAKLYRGAVAGKLSAKARRALAE